MTRIRRAFASLVLLLCATAALAGGPIYTFDYENRIPYAWKMESWPNGQVPVFTDLGTLGYLSNQRANELVAFAVNQWSSVPTSSFRNAVVGDFSLLGLDDITYSNAASVIGAWNGGGITVIYDSDGSVLANFFGLSPSNVLGLTNIDYASPTGEILEAWMVLSGPGIRSNDGDGVGFQGVVTHEMGHALNLAHSQANGAVQSAYVLDAPAPDGCAAPWGSSAPDATQIETMYPLSVPEPGKSGEYMATVDRIDDIAALSDIYPAPGYPEGTGTIRGTVYDADGQPVGAVNVIARNVTAPFDDFSSYITGQVSKGQAGPDGSFVFNGLTPGARYVLYVDNLEWGSFTINRIPVLPGPEEYYNGEMENSDAAIDDRCAWSTVAVTPGAPVTADIRFGRYAGAPQLITAPELSIPSDITPDGKIVVGGFYTYGPVFRWNLETGTFENLGGHMDAMASISDDATKISANVIGSDGISYAAIYTDATGWTALPPTPGAVPCDSTGHGLMYTAAHDISGDGNTVVGLSYGYLGCNSASIRGFKWTAAGGSVQLPKVNSMTTAGRANAVNYDGSVIGGWDDASTGYRRGVIWKNGVASLPLYKGQWVGEIDEVTRDGVWAIGSAAYGTQGQLWRDKTTTKVVELLGNLPHYDGGTAAGMNDASTVITGVSTSLEMGVLTGGIWTAQLHWSSFNDFLWNQGVNSGGIGIRGMTTTSASGTVMAGLADSRWGFLGIVLKTPTSVVCHTPANDPTHPQTTVATFPLGLDAALLAGDTLGPCACSATTPTGIPVLSMAAATATAATLNWSTVSTATGYDIARGDLGALLASAGDFSAATTDCLENALRANTYTDSDLPKEGNGFWYLVRPVSCGGRGTYDSGSTSQVGSRDAGIQASTVSCP